MSEPQRKIIFKYESGMAPVPTKIAKKEKETKSDFELMHLIEFTGDQIKLEKAKYQSSKKVEVINVCMAYHGGPLDHPKVTSKSIGDVVAKWDYCYEKILGAENAFISKQNSVEHAEHDNVEEKNTGENDKGML